MKSIAKNPPIPPAQRDPLDRPGQAVAQPVAQGRAGAVLPAGPAPEPAAGGWVVCLCAEWCGACRDYRPVFAALAPAQPPWRFAWVDVEDHAELADELDVETFPTLLIADAAGTRFLGPLLPHAATLRRLLGALPPAQASTAEVQALLAALAASAAGFVP